MREKIKMTVPAANRTVREVGKRGARWLESSHISIRLVKEQPVTAEAGFSWEAPAEYGEHEIEVELSYPVNPWEHEGAGAISWGARLDRLAPLGEEAVSIIKEAWEQRDEGPHDPAGRAASSPTGIGFASRSTSPSTNGGGVSTLATRCAVTSSTTGSSSEV